MYPMFRLAARYFTSTKASTGKNILPLFMKNTLFVYIYAVYVLRTPFFYPRRVIFRPGLTIVPRGVRQSYIYSHWRMLIS